MFGPNVTILDTDSNFYSFNAESIQTGKFTAVSVYKIAPTFIQNFIYKSNHYLIGYHKEESSDKIFVLNLETGDLIELPTAD